MECPICFEIISNSCYANCSHHYCYNCLIKWCKKGGTRCPMCKTKMFQIIQDKEFDMKNNPKCKDKIEKPDTRNIYVSFHDKILPGITLTDRIIQSNKVSISGVIVSDLESDKKLIDYLKVNDVILYLNGIPCIKSYNVAEIIRHYSNTQGMLKIELEDKKVKLDRIFCCVIF